MEFQVDSLKRKVRERICRAAAERPGVEAAIAHPRRRRVRSRVRRAIARPNRLKPNRPLQELLHAKSLTKPR